MAKGKSRSSNIPVVSGSKEALNQMKYEIAAELGLPVGQHVALNPNMEFATELGTIAGNQIAEDYWGHIASRDTGAVGGQITRRLVQQAEQALFSFYE